MRSTFGYIRPESLDEALQFLREYGDEASPVAGGTDLSIAVRAGELTAGWVVDISRLSEVRQIRLTEGELHIGAGATFTDIVDSDVVREHAPVLAKASRCIGSLQIRNVGTIGGNVANASPAADSLPPLMVHEARAVVRSCGDERQVPLHRLIAGAYRNTLNPGELITEFVLEPMKQGWEFAFERIARRRALAVARMNCAVLAAMTADGKIEDVRLSAGSITPAPCRMNEAERVLVGETPSLDLFRRAAEEVSREMIRQSGIRHSTEYKKPAVEGIVIKALAGLSRI